MGEVDLRLQEVQAGGCARLQKKKLHVAVMAFELCYRGRVCREQASEAAILSR